jgi:GNAT superfamily N-acetyltransferase
VSGPSEESYLPVPVPVEVVRPLRSAVLRPGQPPWALVNPGDDDPSSLHLAVMIAGELVGTATVMRDGYPGGARPGDWRVRGMAVVASRRGRGIGSALLSACEAHVRTSGGSRIWCNARVAARNLYLKGGMVIEGDEFEIPGIGPHLLMSKELD